MSKRDKGLDIETQKKAGNFLFDQTELDIDEKLDQRTRVKSKEAFQAIMFYDVIGYLVEGEGEVEKGEEETINVGRAMGRILKNLFIADKGEARKEGVAVLQRGIVDVKKILAGTENLNLEE